MYWRVLAAVVSVLVLVTALLYAVRTETPPTAMVRGGAPTGAATSSTPASPATPAATFTVPTIFAAACGTVGDRVAKTGAANASFVISSPRRAPLKIAWTSNAPIDIVPAGYVCVSLQAGMPLPIFDGLIGRQMPGFVAEGTFPATAARPAPTGFVLPQACVFVAPPVVGTDATKWAVDCGAQANHDARGTLGPALTQQGWTSCAIGLGTMQVKKNGVMLGVQESTLAPGEYPGLTQFARLIWPCL